jgi:hypothetical protein
MDILGAKLTFELVFIFVMAFILLFLIAIELHISKQTIAFFKEITSEVQNAGLDIFEEAHPCEVVNCENFVAHDDIPCCSYHPYKEEDYINYSYRKTHRRKRS